MIKYKKSGEMHLGSKKSIDRTLILKRFTSKIDFSSNNGCHLWRGCLDRQGYGFFHFMDKQHRAHRAAYILYKGDIPNGLLVCHKCDNPRCVNPRHLFLGTVQDNTDDKVKKRRLFIPFGSKHGNSKLTERDVIEMRAMKRLGESIIDIAIKFKIHKQTANQICAHERWKHIP